MKHSGNDWILWVLLAACCLIAIFLVYPVTKTLTGEMFIAVAVTVIVAAILCIVVWQIWTQLDNFKGKRKEYEPPVKALDEPPMPTIEIHNHNINLNSNVASAEASSYSSAAANATSESNPTINACEHQPESDVVEDAPFVNSDGAEGTGENDCDTDIPNLDPLEVEEQRIKKLVSELPDESRLRVPFDIRTDDGLFILVMLREGGFLDAEFWPTYGNQKTNVAFMVMCIACSLQLPEYGRWAMFEKFWNMTNLRNLFNKSKKEDLKNANEYQRGVVGVFRKAIKLNENLDTNALYNFIRDCPDE